MGGNIHVCDDIDNEFVDISRTVLSLEDGFCFKEVSHSFRTSVGAFMDESQSGCVDELV